MTTASSGNGAGAKPQGRDSALTWEVPDPVEDASMQARLAEFELAYSCVARLHINKLVEQLLSAEGAAHIAVWTPIISELAQRAAELLSPTALHSIGSLNPRDSLKVKRYHMTSGTACPPTGYVVDGVVCQGSLAHKRMRTRIQNPRIVALAGNLEYDRPRDKLSSFDALMDTEKQHLKAKVENVMTAQPDVVLVEGSVARYAQELFLDAGVSLVTHMKDKLLRRVARCVGSILQSAGGGPLEAGCEGTCKEFEVRSISEVPNEEMNSLVLGAPEAGSDTQSSSTQPAPLLFFRGCCRGLGSCIVLESGNAEELAKVKRVAVNAGYAAYWNRLEVFFLSYNLFAVASCEGPLHDAGQRWLARTAAGTSAAQAASRRVKNIIDGTGVAEDPILFASPHISTHCEPSHDSDGSAAPTEEEVLQSVPSFSDSQALQLSISCRNPAKQNLCETPHLHSMPFYGEGDMAIIDFLSAAAPTNRKCPHPQCGDGAALHLRSFMHGDSLITLSSFHISPGHELDGGDESKLWLWLRPIGVVADQTLTPLTRRVPLPPEAACMSFAHLLALLLDARDMHVEGIDLQHGFVRYLGCGNSIICLHHTRIKPYSVRLPPLAVHVARDEQEKWLREEIMALAEEADEVFSLIQENLTRVHMESQASDECGDLLASLRESYMSTVLDVQSLAEGQEMLSAINKLRRYLLLVAQQWDLALGQTSVASKAELEVMMATIDQHSVVASGSHHAHSDSISSSEQGQHQLEECSIRPVISAPTNKYSAPKLVDTTESQDAASSEATQGEAIPTGLVARYVARFEDVEQSSKDSGSPKSSVATGDIGERTALANSSGQYLEYERRPSTTIDLRGFGKEPTIHASSTEDPMLETNPKARIQMRQPEDIKLEELKVQLERLNCRPHDTHGRKVSNGHPADSLPSQKHVKGRPLLPDGPDHVPVTVFDNEPTSVVAYFLSTRQYRDYVAQAKEACLGNATTENPKTVAEIESADDRQILCASLQLDCQMLAEDILPFPLNNRARFTMTAYYAPHFAALRRLFVAGGEAAFLASIARCQPWSAQGGKSNVFFAKTKDDRYVVKQLTRSEKQSILTLAPDYFKYINGVLTSGGRTCLSKIIGVYQVTFEYSGNKPGKDGSLDFLIMENLFHGCEIDTVYDLKGSERDRYVSEPKNKNSSSVLLDENLRELNQASPTLVYPVAFERLQRSLCDDTNFLAALDVMDYSLLVGFDKTGRELVVGLVDYVRQYTWDKQVESWVKQSGLLGGAGKEPTIISPRQYARRFRTAMLSYFTVVPALGVPSSAE